MKRIEFMLAVSFAMFAFVAGAAAQSDSLGDYARAVRKEKRPVAKKSYTNDNLPNSASISIVGAPDPAGVQDNQQGEAPAAKLPDDKSKQDKGKAQKEDSAVEKKTPQDDKEWAGQIADQKKHIADLEHELELLQREHNLRVADYYGNPSYGLAEQKKWLDDETKSRAEIADKQKQVDQAKAELQEMEEGARKASVTSSPAE
jgi:hypothetical protein